MSKKNAKYPQLGQKLKELRGPKTQMEMATILKIPLRTYHRYESGERIPPHTLLTRIASEFKTTVESITELAVLESMKEALRHPIHIDVRDVVLNPGAFREIEKRMLLRGEDPVLVLVKVWIGEFWKSASKEEKIWFKVQFGKCFPQFKDWLKKRPKTGS